MLRVSGWSWLNEKYAAWKQSEYVFGCTDASNIKQQLRESSNQIKHASESATKRKGRSIFLFLPLTAFGLGTWQVYRYQWKVGIMQEVERKSNLPPVILDDSVVHSLQLNKSDEHIGILTQQDLDFRTVQSTGRYLYDQEVLIGPRQHQGQNGFHVVTPFQIRDGTKILVNRGWIPSDLKDPKRRVQYRVTENVIMQGMLRKKTPKASFVPENEPDKGMWYWIDIPALAQHMKSYPLLVDLNSKPNQSCNAEGDNTNQSLPIPAGIKYNMLHPKDHLGYAATWYLISESSIDSTKVLPGLGIGHNEPAVFAQRLNTNKP